MSFVSVMTMLANSSTSISGGTGQKLGHLAVILAGIASLIATILSFISIWLQCKNYRKPLLQRYVIRILLMVPIYAISSWVSLMSIKAATYIDPIRDIYEAFTIYTFFQLLINFLGGERSLIIMMHGRPPKSQPWPLNHCLPKVDISDPHTFLAIKRGILQYAWLKPILSVATILMKWTGTYKEGYLGIDGGYLWLGILYNVSVTLSLYSLAMFWVCMADDLKPFRPVPKFLCIKLIIFASYWQGFFLSILQWLGAIPNDVDGYSADNLAAAIQDALICFEMPLFAIAHWYAFSWHDYADKTISAARMPVKHALRDAFGPRDLIEDTRETLYGRKYDYRTFDAQDDVMTHEDSGSRVARMKQGMRYTRQGKAKYWIPKPGEATGGAQQSLLGEDNDENCQPAQQSRNYGTASSLDFGALDAEDERLFGKARGLEFGDWNYPVITAHVPARDLWLHSEPELLTTSTHRKALHPSNQSRQRRQQQIEERHSRASKGKGRSRSRHDSHGSTSPTRAPIVGDLVRQASDRSSGSQSSGRSQLVDLVVENSEAEEAERVRARKEGGAVWNEDAPRHFVRTYDDEDQGDNIRHGFDPSQVPPGRREASGETNPWRSSPGPGDGRSG